MKTVTACIFFLCFRGIVALNAQNAFEEFGYKGRVLTMTNGRFNETHDADSVVQIGSVLFDVNKKKIIGYAEIDTVTYMPNPTIISRWWSIDPLAEKYYGLSPYNFVANNPVIFVDPDGRDINVTFTGGTQARDLFNKVMNQMLGGQFQITLTSNKDGSFRLGLKDSDALGVDKNGNKIKGDVNKLSEGAQKFYTGLSSMINDHSNTLNVNLSYADENTHTGNYKTQTVDMADINQWPQFDHSMSQQLGATQGGKIYHEMREFWAKTVSADGRKRPNDWAQSDHDNYGIPAENRINGNTRDDRGIGPPRGQGVFERYILANGKVIIYRVVGGPNSATQPIITVIPKN